VLNACAANRERDLADLVRLCAQPSISAQGVGMADCAALVRGLLEGAGLATRLLPSPGRPMVFGERPGPPGAPTLLLYGHYLGPVAVLDPDRKRLKFGLGLERVDGHDEPSDGRLLDFLPGELPPGPLPPGLLLGLDLLLGLGDVGVQLAGVEAVV
jgi:hypothetical protein